MIEDAVTLASVLQDDLRRNKLRCIEIELYSGDLDKLEKTIEMPLEQFSDFNFPGRLPAQPVGSHPTLSRTNYRSRSNEPTERLTRRSESPRWPTREAKSGLLQKTPKRKAKSLPAGAVIIDLTHLDGGQSENHGVQERDNDDAIDLKIQPDVVQSGNHKSFWKVENVATELTTQSDYGQFGNHRVRGRTMNDATGPTTQPNDKHSEKYRGSGRTKNDGIDLTSDSEDEHQKTQAFLVRTWRAAISQPARSIQLPNRGRDRGRPLDSVDAHTRLISLDGEYLGTQPNEGSSASVVTHEAFTSGHDFVGLN
jgi:hypothetical protein